MQILAESAKTNSTQRTWEQVGEIIGFETDCEEYTKQQTKIGAQKRRQVVKRWTFKAKYGYDLHDFWPIEPIET
jgi:hypothetical protein